MTDYVPIWAAAVPTPAAILSQYCLPAIVGGAIARLLMVAFLSVVRRGS